MNLISKNNSDLDDNIDKLLESNVFVDLDKISGSENESGNDQNISVSDSKYDKLVLNFIEDTSDNEIEDKSYMVPYYKYVDDFIDQNIKEEPILSDKSERYTVYPIQYPSIWKNYKTQLKNNWVVEEVDLSIDVEHWKNELDDNERFFLMHVLAFFATADGIVNTNAEINLVRAVKIKEAKCGYAKQIEMENCHGEMYSLMIDTLICDEKLK